jgi:hypothetical protein
MHDQPSITTTLYNLSSQSECVLCSHLCVFSVSPQEILLPPRFRALSHSQSEPHPHGIAVLQAGLDPPEAIYVQNIPKLSLRCAVENASHTLNKSWLQPECIS